VGDDLPLLQRSSTSGSRRRRSLLELFGTGLAIIDVILIIVFVWLARQHQMVVVVGAFFFLGRFFLGAAPAVPVATAPNSPGTVYLAWIKYTLPRR
jgi:hypothetical protein